MSTTYAHVIADCERYGRTGFGLGLYRIQPGRLLDAYGECLDAPQYIPCGSVRSCGTNVTDALVMREGFWS